LKRLHRRAALLLPLAATGCSVLDNILSPAKPPLPGKRESVVAARRGLALDGPAIAVSVPPPATLAEWPQAGGNATHAVGHVALNSPASSALQPAWRASIGEGGGYRQKVTAQPLVAGGRVFTMDSDGVVASFDLANGNRIWRTETQGEKDRSTNVGGGIAVAGGILYATTGRGEALALDGNTGAIRWRKDLDTPGRSAPCIADGRLFITTLDNRLLSLKAANGERQWTYQAASTATTVLSQSAPAYSDGLVVAGFESGDLAAVRAESGALAWTDSLAASRGRNSVVDLAAVRGLPVVDGGRVFAIGVGGLLVSLDLRSGRRLWEREAGGLETPWLAGDTLFVQTLDQTLAAIGREDGKLRWLTDLPRYDDPEKRRDPLFWTGPILAGGRLVLAGSNETALSVNPADGKIIGRQELRGAAAVTPIAAAGTLFILTDDGSLQAFR
jgi:outer membrane protein assembly factor BamB